MNIAMDVRVGSVFSSGIGNYIRSLLGGIREIDKDNSYYMYSHKFPVYLTDKFPRESIKKTLFSFENHPLGDIWLNTILPLQLSYNKIDIYHGPSNIIPAVKKGFKKVVTVHDLVAFSNPEYLSSKYSCYMRYMIKNCIYNADTVIAISESTKKDIIKYLNVSDNKVKVIYEAAENDYKPVCNKEELKKFRAKYKIDEDFILSIAKDEPRKNLITLVKAFSGLKRKVKEVYGLVICLGSSKISNELNIAVSQGDLKNRVKIIYNIERDEMPLLYNSASLFVLPSLYEGFGLPLIEAMKCGLPVIASDNSSIPELIGDAGLLIDGKDIEGLAYAMEEVLLNNNSMDKMAEKSILQGSKFTWENTAKETLKAYEGVG